MATGSILAFRDPILDANISQAALDNLTLALSAMQREAAVAYAFEDSYLKESIITVALSTMFFGLFTVLAGVAAYVLSSKGIKRTTTAIMLTAILLMWMSTVAYWIGTIVAAAEAYTRVHNLMLRSLGQANMMQDCLYPPTANSHVAPKGCQRVPETEPLYNIEEYEIHDCIGTVALTVNVIIGDTIVWWRALVLWPDNRVVRSVCAIMILLTTVTGVMDAKDACKVVEEVIHDFTHPAPGSSSAVVYVSGSTTGIWFGGDVWGYIALLFSLSTNIVATTLIAYRAWEHRRIIMSYLKGSSPRTQVERTLALLVESGLLYCGLWVVIAVYELSYAASPLAVLESTGFVRFKHGLYYMMQGCIVPLIVLR
ncbi:hypothetical protein OH76DRAFT_1082402 [Lentinus brumalis]|uniref:Uncharacterized protein n=1 Tax=Lentinus brumalis TaxID=2498619 RepID=A0A371DP63_9APHY|nr:hypothetical protein OH76DRAFT_1082402 [Polyporus brumalis]